MGLLWERGPLSLAEAFQAQPGQLGYTTIQTQLNRLVEKGMAIVMVSSDLPEVIGMSDRVLTLHEGKLSAELSGPDMTQEKIMMAATGTAGS